MLKNGKCANRNEHQNRKTELFWHKDRKTYLKNSRNRKTKNPNAPLLSLVLQRTTVFTENVSETDNCVITCLESMAQGIQLIPVRASSSLRPLKSAAIDQKQNPTLPDLH